MKLMSEKIAEVKSLEEDVKLQEYSSKLYNLRKDGVNKVMSLQQEIQAAKRNKLLDADERNRMIADWSKQIVEARQIAAENRDEEKQVEKEAVAYSNSIAKDYIASIISEQNAQIASLTEGYQQEVAKIRSDAGEEIARIQSSGKDPETVKAEVSVCKYEMNSSLFDAKSRYRSTLARCKAAKNQAFVDHVQKNRALRNGKSKFSEDFNLSIREYIYNFTPSKFFLENGLYLAILVFFIVCVIIAPMSGRGALFSLPNILTIFEQSSTRMFYALGVAGLILQAGTDLSVGRMVALGSVTTGLILHPGVNIVKFFGMGPWDFTGLPMGLRVGMALFLSIFLCVLFSSFAGVFTAKLKIHPFISTLATQLIIYGLLFFGTTGTPVGSIESEIKDMIGGRWFITPTITFPKLVIPAVIAIIVAWFIWNKTTFGKNMYAVGGNSEAAAVSGISVFGVTMGVFIMAGIFYGCGAFLEAFRANASAGTGQGYEMDAIAACVVGGISFNGGIGKIGGAAIGVVIFTGLTYCLTFLGIDTNLQFVFKGFIIIAAVALDSVKYLKKK